MLRRTTASVLKLPATTHEHCANPGRHLMLGRETKWSGSGMSGSDSRRNCSGSRAHRVADRRRGDGGGDRADRERGEVIGLALAGGETEDDVPVDVGEGR